MIAEWLVNGRQLRGGDDTTIAEVVTAYWKHVKVYYRHPDGSPTSERDTIKQALKPL